jgi:hypothetical protein
MSKSEKMTKISTRNIKNYKTRRRTKLNDRRKSSVERVLFKNTRNDAKDLKCIWSRKSLGRQESSWNERQTEETDSAEANCTVVYEIAAVRQPRY